MRIIVSYGRVLGNENLDLTLHDLIYTCRWFESMHMI